MANTAYQLFCAIAELGNMSRAAEQLHLTPSAASHAIHALERAYGFPLFTRDRNGATLTGNGQLLLPHIRSILAAEARLAEEIDQLNGLDKGLIRLGVFNSVCTNWLPSILCSFHQKYPQVTVQICQEGYPAIEKMLIEGRLDLAFVSLPASEKFATITLTHDRLLCVTPPDYTPRDGEYITAEDLRGMPLILSQRGYDRVTENFVHAHGLEPYLQHYITLESSAIALVESGMGCSLLPELMLKGHSGRYRVFPLKDNKYRTIALATLKGQAESPAVAKMIEEIRVFIESISTRE